MTSLEIAKLLVISIQKQNRDSGIKTKLSAIYEMVAHQQGYKDWNTMCAYLKTLDKETGRHRESNQ